MTLAEINGNGEMRQIFPLIKTGYVINLVSSDVHGKQYILKKDFFSFPFNETLSTKYKNDSCPPLISSDFCRSIYEMNTGVFYTESLSDISISQEEFLDKIIEKYRLGIAEFENLLEEYLAEFPKTNENLVLAVKKIIISFENYNPIKPMGIDWNSIDAYFESYRSGVLYRACDYISERIDFFLPYNFSFIEEKTQEISKNNILQSNIPDHWTGTAKEYENIINILLKNGYLKTLNYSSDHVWQEPTGKTGGPEFSSFLLLLYEKGLFDYMAFTTEELYAVCNNTFKLQFKFDTLKKGKISEAAKNLTSKKFKKLLEL